MGAQPGDAQPHPCAESGGALWLRETGVRQERREFPPLAQSGCRQEYAGWRSEIVSGPQETSGFASGFEKLFYAGAHVFVGDVFAAVERG